MRWKLPLAAAEGWLQTAREQAGLSALIALGAVVRGETYHFEIVSNESASGIMTVQLDSGVPIANGILTTENDEQALARMTEKALTARWRRSRWQTC